MGKYDDIPQNLIERAITGLNREIPSREVLVKKLGEFGSDVEAFVKHLEAIDFFAHVGEPIQHFGEDKLERAEDWEAAISASLEKDSLTLIDGIFKTQRSLVEEHNRQDLSDAAFDLYNEYTSLSIPQEVRGTVKGALFCDIQGALDELIL